MRQDKVKFAGFAMRRSTGVKYPPPKEVRPDPGVLAEGGRGDPSKPCFSTWIAAKLGVPRIRATFDDEGALKLLPAEWDISKMEGTEVFEACKDVARLRGRWDYLTQATEAYEAKRLEHLGRQFAGVPRRERKAYMEERMMLNAHQEMLSNEYDRCVKELGRLKEVLERTPKDDG